MKAAQKIAVFREKLAKSDDRYLVELSTLSDRQLVIIKDSLSELENVTVSRLIPSPNFADVYITSKISKN
tara:strand:- start:234 stop:443 length:210 start_codon:yes stop_codon:yes gene_type:complete